MLEGCLIYRELHDTKPVLVRYGKKDIVVNLGDRFKVQYWNPYLQEYEINNGTIMQKGKRWYLLLDNGKEMIVRRGIRAVMLSEPREEKSLFL